MVIINSLLAIHLDSIRTNDILGDDNYRTDQSSTAEAKDEVKENNEDIEVEKPAPRDKIPPTWRIDGLLKFLSGQHIGRYSQRRVDSVVDK